MKMNHEDEERVRQARTVYPPQSPIDLDRAGGYYSKHVSAMTGEALHTKSDIAEQLASRDMRIDALLGALAECTDGWKEHEVVEETVCSPERAKELWNLILEARQEYKRKKS